MDPHDSNAAKQSAAPRADVNVVTLAIKTLFEPGQVVELRAEGGRYTTSGYYSDFNLLAADTVRVSANKEHSGVYWTLQKINPALFARSPNSYIDRAKVTTSDNDVECYRWLPLDFDPVRPAGISSTEDEKALARIQMELAAKYFGAELNTPALSADSGNGYHLLVRIDLPPEDEALLKKAIAALSMRFATDKVNVDTVVFNPARIWKAYGTVARKGGHTLERPHRIARLLRVPSSNPLLLARETIEKLAAEAPSAKGPKNKRPAAAGGREAKEAKLLEFLKSAAVEHEARRDWGGVWMWKLKACPFDAAHGAGGEVIVTLGEAGESGFKCHHNSCADNHWQQFREKLEEKIGHRFDFGGEQSEVPDGTIIVEPGRLTAAIEESERVLVALNPPIYYESQKRLVFPTFARELATREKDADTGIRRDDQSVVLAGATKLMLRRHLDQNARFGEATRTKHGPSVSFIFPPGEVVAQILDRIYGETEKTPFPHIDQVVNAPVLLPSGEVHREPGQLKEGVLMFGEVGEVYADPDGSAGGLWPFQHSRQEAGHVIKHTFWPMFANFPFKASGTRPKLKGDSEWRFRRKPLAEGESEQWWETPSFAVVLAGIFTLVARPYLLNAPVPMLGISAPKQRSGKTHLADMIAISATGHKPTTVTYADETEFGKLLFPILLAQDRCVLIDNVNRTLSSAKLAPCVTGGKIEDRILGASEKYVLRNVSLFVTTGNNLTVGGDLASRTLLCRIDPNMERPESRSFRFDPVEEARRMFRAEPIGAVAATLIALRAYVAAGMPWLLERDPFGDFTRWDKLISGCLVWLGYADPGETRYDVADSDPEREAALALLSAWHEEFKTEWVPLRQIKDKADGPTRALLLSKGAWEEREIGWRMRRLRDVVIDGFKLEKNAKAKQATWRVRKSDETPIQGQTPPF